MLTQQIVNGLTLGAIYALIALGYTLVYGILAMINFAHSEILMLGAFVALGLSLKLGPAAGVLALIALFAGSMAAAGLLNALVERAAYRPLRHISRLAPLISAIGVSIVLQNVVFLWVSNQSLKFPDLVALRQFDLGGGASVSSLQVSILSAALVLMALLHFFIEHTKMGKSMRACSDDIETAGLMGIDANKVIALTFVVGGALGGAAGILYGMYYGSIKYNLGFLPGAKAFTAAVLGGIGNIRGAVLGGFILGMLETMAAGYVADGAQWKDVIAFSVLIVVLLLRPSGLLGEKIADKI